MRRLGVLVATAAGAGYFPVAPGTVGSAVGLAVYFLTRDWAVTLQFAMVASVILVGTWASDEAARHFNREDPGHVVIDEVAGQLVTLMLFKVTIVGAVAGFLIFRLFDIVKPWPARQLEALPGGVGIMADDLMAGVYSWLTLAILIRVLPGLV